MPNRLALALFTPALSLGNEPFAGGPTVAANWAQNAFRCAASARILCQLARGNSDHGGRPAALDLLTTPIRQDLTDVVGVGSEVLESTEEGS